jgi:large subunit ribosomal protein L23
MGIKDLRNIIIKPIVTEKSVRDIESSKYTFEVDVNSNKVEIKKAVEELFKVKVKDVNTIKIKGKTKFRRMVYGRTKDVKKAVVTLREGHKIELFEV